MRHSIAVKFIAFTLCVLSLVTAAGSGAGIILTEGYGLYSDTLENRQRDRMELIANELAWYYAQQHAAESYGNCPQDILMELYDSYYANRLGDRYAVEVYQEGELVSTVNDKDRYEMRRMEIVTNPSYPVITSQYTADEYGPHTGAIAATVPDVTEAAAETAEDTAVQSASADVSAAATSVPDLKRRDDVLLYSSEHADDVWDTYGNHRQVVYTMNYYQGPEYRVDVYLATGSGLLAEFGLMEMLYGHRNEYIPLLLISLLLFAVTMVYLCAAAGHAGAGEIRPGGLNRLPLDLYLLIAAGGIVLLIFPMSLVAEAFYGYNELGDNMQLCLLIVGLCAGGIAALALGFLFALVAQMKAGSGYWWRRSIIGFLLSKVSGACAFLMRGCRAVFRLLPVIWQWLLVAAAMAGAIALFLFLSIVTYGYAQLMSLALLLASILAGIAVICYGGCCFGTLMKGARAMAQGELYHQIPTHYMLGAFRDFANQLNSLAGAAQVAAEKQLKSERMKTELITNVSHDIKTPLTSIINFVDLLKKPHSEAEQSQYLDVLDRQSQRLKKLIDDLMEMSKASTGNLSVELGQVDAAEAVNQALGEFADKLDAARLTPVFRHPEEPVTMTADGRLVWRVLSNLLSNAVKYALPDTRLYIDLMVLQGNAVIAIKNISRDQLNVNAEELMERFVRGDTSRNTEGSGLGLNIAKSLVELQKGQMHLMVDGDLFKVTLIFPLA
ncbi:MAG: sensor histidine kinase [Oscillospiraceae bacterium]|nr:sensor histidine kinase [Oscillospiraceae bacterium]